MHPLLLSGSPILDVDATLLVYVAVFFVLFFVLRAFVECSVRDCQRPAP